MSVFSHLASLASTVERLLNALPARASLADPFRIQTASDQYHAIMKLDLLLPLSVLLGVMNSAVAAAPPSAPLGALTADGVRVEGVVQAIADNAFLLADEQAEVRVELKHLRLLEPPLTAGERLTVMGDFRRNRLEARLVIRSDGTSTEAGALRPPSRGSAGKGKSRPVMLDERAPDIPAGLPPNGLPALLAAAGYRYLGPIELHRNHYEVLAENPWRERVEVHVDFNGQIYRERIAQP